MIYRWLPLAISIALLFDANAARADRLVTLGQAYRMALKSNPTIVLLRERVKQAEAERFRAWSALKPTAGFQASFTHFDQEIAFEVPDLTNPAAGSSEFVFQKQNQFGFQATATLPLFRGPAYPSLSMAYKRVRMARMTNIRSTQDFLLQVANAYYVVVSQQEVVRAIAEKDKVNAKHLAAAKARHAVGQSPRVEVLRAELVATQDRQRLRSQRNALAAARRRLAILLGQRGSVAVQRPPVPPDPRRRGMVRTALGRRTDYKASGVAVDVALTGKRIAWWSFFPSLDLTWVYRWSEASGFADDKDSWNLMFSLTLPLYDGGGRYADLRRAKSMIREARAQRRALAQRIESDIVKLKADLASAEAGVISARKAVKLARTTAGDMDASFSVGAATQLDVLDASHRRLEAEIQLTRSLYQRDLARLALAHAMGVFDPARESGR